MRTVLPTSDRDNCRTIKKRQTRLRGIVVLSLVHFIEPFRECNPLRFLDGICDVDQ